MPDAADELRHAERDLAKLEESVQRLGPTGRGPLLAVILIVLAFTVGLVRPWDWLGLGSGAASASPDASASGAGVVASPGAGTTLPPASSVPAIDAAAAQTCDYPQSWRSATVQDWAGRRARVWTAVDAVAASGPLDPAVTYTVVAGSAFTAIGWCAPVEGPQRPPDDAVGTLYRVNGATAVRLAVTLLEPAAPNPLAGLFGPAVAAVGSASPAAGSGAAGRAWPPGRYVIGLATPDGGWARWIGVDLRLVPIAAPSEPAAGSSPSQPAASAAPSGS